jgi:hypothetical protein
MSTPNFTYPIPPRLNKINELVGLIAQSANDWTQGNKSADNGNLLLAMCEVAVSLPPRWFAAEEQMMIGLVIKEVYGDPKKFIDDLNEGTVSFYSKFRSEAQLPTESLTDLIGRMYEAHINEFGLKDH